jgi:DNA-binding IclR family transcriptional regulator
LTLDKAMLVLRTLRDAEVGGMQAGEIVAATGLHRVTLHRLLRSLDEQGLIEQDDARRYHLGPQVWLLGMAANRRFDLHAVAEGALERLEAATHDTIYLLRRVGDDVLCVARRDGSYPIKSLVMEVGKSYPLGVGGGGLAVLLPMPDAERRDILTRAGARLKAYPKVTTAKIRELLADAQRNGYAFWPALISEALVVAVPILDREGAPLGALSCAALKERLEPARRREVAALLQREADAIHRRLGGGKAAAQ